MCEQKCFFFKEGICSSDTMTLNSLRYEQINFKCFPGATSCIEILLLSDDHFYQNPISLQSTFVCSAHKQEFLKQYWPSTYRKCWLCIALQKPSPNTSERNINADQALTIYEKFHIRHSYGKTICARCRFLLTTYSNIDNIQHHKEAFEWINDIVTSEDNSTTDDESDDSYEEPQFNTSPYSHIQSTSNLDKKKRELLNEFLHLCGSNKQIKITNSYHSLQKQSKANFLSCARNLITHIFEFLARNESDDVQQDLFPFDKDSDAMVNDRQFAPMMRGIAEAYDNAENWATRRSILSIVAPKVNFSVLQSFIPGINHYRFTSARLHASDAGTGVIIERVPRVICRFEPAQIMHFIDFIVSNYVCTDLPYGQQTLMLSDGTKLHVPNTIRNCNSTRIINQYYQYTTELFPGFSVLHESTLHKILDECKASTRRALNCINYFAANGSEAVDTLLELINSLNLDKSEHHRLTSNLKKGKQYLKTDFKVNVTRTSRVRDHCICFSLSDPASNAFSTACSDHTHDQVCSECLYLAQTLQDIRQLIQDSKGDEEEIKRKMYKFTLAYDAIQAWKCHQLRAVNQDLGRECILDIISEDVIYLNLDFAMKWIPAKYREPQSNFFGKRGVTWHITVVSRKKKQEPNNIDMITDIQEQDSNTITELEEDFIESEEEKTNLNDFEHTVFIHVIDQCPQDSKLVVAIIADVLERLKTYDDSIEQACIRSDNAGSSDRFAAILKSHVRRYLNEKHDVTNAEQFVEACLSYGGVKNVNVVECRLKPVRQSAKFQLNHIKKFRNFCFERHGIRVFRAWDIGEGVLLPYNKLIYGKVNISLLDVIQPSSIINFGSSSNTNSPPEKDANLNVESIESSNKHTNLFECPEEACICSYIKYGNLLRHLAIGHHRKMPEKLILLDTAKKLYHSKLVAAENKTVISLSPQHALLDPNNFDQLPQLNMGWGLPVVRPPVRFSIKQKQFLDESFKDDAAVNETIERLALMRDVNEIAERASREKR
ncbi:unnamed protein product [Rotaria sordida]|uniref:C2H2-type domain-containing protein n=1 Tax=Rotaria sordida TaxID=392033 RepID=A0A815C036_9BILA|nr:unnamed protein product [Rotaria sordida]CAF4095542.1 unnamed protein product [Rotaria sordida]